MPDNENFLPPLPGETPNPAPAPATTPPQPKRKRRWLRKTLIVIGLLIFLPLTLLLGVAYFFNDVVTQQVVREVNKSLKTELKISDVSLSLLSGFPEAAVNLSGIRLKDNFGGYLLVAQQASFRFDARSLFSDKIEVYSVVITDGVLRAHVDSRGRVNYDITKPTPDEPESNLAIALQNAELHDVRVIYDNALTRQVADVLVNNASLGGNFSAKKFDLSSQATLTVQRIDLDSTRYLAGEKVQYDAVLGVDLTKNLYDLQRVEVSLGDNTFSIDGTVRSATDHSDFDLKLTTREGDVSVLADLLPGAYHTYFNDFQSTGQYTCSGLVKGRLSKNEQPNVTFEVSLRNGQVTSEKLQSPLKNVSFRARLDARAGSESFFEIQDFKADFAGEPLAINLKINNLNDPQVDFKCNGALPLEAAYGLFDNTGITAGDGVVRLNELSVQGRYADMTSMGRINAVTAAGEIQLEQARLTYNKVPVVFETGWLSLADNVFSVDSLRLRVGQSDFALSGTARNLLPVLFADSLNTADAFLDFAAKMHCNYLDADELMGMFAVQETASEAGGEKALDSLKTDKIETRERNTDKLRGTFEAQIKAFNYEKVQANNFRGQLAFDHNELLMDGDLEAMQGQIHLKGNAVFSEQPSLRLLVNCQGLDLSSVLAQCENFGQDVITDQNLIGRLSGRVAVRAFWDATGNFDPQKLRALVDVTGTNGELRGVKMFEDFSTFIHVEDLRSVKFTEMHNYLEIKEQTLFIPTMLLQSNAVNITLSGKHTFNNDIDYRLKVNAGQVLWNRVKKHDPDLDPLPEKKGWLNVYYSVIGNLDKYDMKRGKKAVKAEFERSEALKEQIAAAIETEFAQANVVVAAQ